MRIPPVNRIGRTEAVRADAGYVPDVRSINTGEIFGERTIELGSDGIRISRWSLVEDTRRWRRKVSLGERMRVDLGLDGDVLSLATLPPWATET